MMMWQNIRVQTEVFDLGVEEQILRHHAGDCGALVAFVGLVREFNAGMNDSSAVQSLFLEHFPTVTENEIARIIGDAQKQWPISAVTVIHRVGLLQASEPIVLVLVASAHRAEAFEAAQFIMDFLKTQAPFWKREDHADGHQHWVEAKASDALAQTRWSNTI